MNEGNTQLMEQVLEQLAAVSQQLQISNAMRETQATELRLLKEQHEVEKRARETEYEELKKKVNEISETTQEMSDLFKTLKGGFKVIGWFGHFAKWVGGIIAAGAALYTFYQRMTGKA
jgi:DNA anti-recombination protein RmuC